MSSKRKIYIDRLFPNVNELKLHHKLKINQESIMYITIPDDADQITKIVVGHIHKYFTSSLNVGITDATAGVGGNTISFSYKFRYVDAIEVDQERFNYLKNNVNAYQLSNINLYNADCIGIAPSLANDVIFIDPPWGGKSYKKQGKIKLHLGQQSIEDVCMLFLSKKMSQIPKLIVLKLPKNYDIEHIYTKIKLKYDGEQRKLYMYELNKMIIIVIERGYYSLPSSSTAL
jgi:16S rRNA G966 N2-methylase RsmD